VFVAMSFDHRFDDLWDKVIEPAVGQVDWQGRRLKAHRVNLTKKSDSIIAEIVQNIAEARLVLADISTIGWHRRWLKKATPFRSANVMYEVGIGHSARLAEEIVLIRGDNDLLDFDVRGVRVHQYPRDHGEALAFVSGLLTDALKGVEQRRSLVVRRALRSLSPPMFALLHTMGDIAHPHVTTVAEMFSSGERLDAVRHLLAEGMIEAFYKPLPEDFMERPVAELFSYRVTPFGLVVYQTAREDLRFNDALIPWLQTAKGKAWIREASARAGDSKREPG
jgi:hypothetical protein